MTAILERVFHLKSNKTDVRTEVVAGVTTFLTMAYIIFVQPAILSGAMFHTQTGIDFGAVTVATCVSSAIATAVMAFYANYPIALAPGMGANVFFVLSALPAIAAAGIANTWQTALGAVFISGILFLLLSVVGFREKIIDAVSSDMKNAIAIGIGLFIAFIGLQNANVVVTDPATGVTLNTHFASPDIILFFFGLLLTAGLHVRRVRGSILWGIIATTLLAGIFHKAIPGIPVLANNPTVQNSMLMTRFQMTGGIISAPPSIAPTFFSLDIKDALSVSMIPFIVIFLFMDMFDTIGTLIGVSEQAGLIVDNKLPRAREP